MTGAEDKAKTGFAAYTRETCVKVAELVRAEPDYDWPGIEP
jgi:hypothetical protein